MDYNIYLLLSIILIAQNISCQLLNDTSQTNCSSIKPQILEDCLVGSTNENTCCLNQNRLPEQPSICSPVVTTAAGLINGTLIQNSIGNFTLICLNSGTTDTIPRTCGSSNPQSPIDCTPFSRNELLYLCCYSKITVGERSKAACIPTRNEQTSILDFQSGGVFFTCKSKTLLTSSLAFISLFLILT